MTRPLIRLALTLLVFALPATARAQPRTFPLEDTASLRVHNVHAQAVTHDGKTGVRVVADTIALSRLPATTGRADPDMFALIDRVSFSSGTIEAEISGVPAPGVGCGGGLCRHGGPARRGYAQISSSVGTFLPAITLPIRDTFIRCL